MANQKNQSNYWSEGIIRCGRYAFMPNKLSFCGPDKNKDLFYYCSQNQADRGLELILAKFQTLYPYLRFIARANKIKDPFDQRVIEAYWIGNHLLENIDRPSLYRHLTDNLAIKKKINLSSYQELKNRIRLGARPHHNFHVFSVWRRTGHWDLMHTLSSMDLCRISWGRVVKVAPQSLEVIYQPLVFVNNRLALGQSKVEQVAYQTEGKSFLKEVSPGDWVSIHWGFACEILTDWQVAYLKKYTLENINLANFN